MNRFRLSNLFRHTDGLAVRLVLLLTIALVPLGTVAVFTSAGTVREARRSTERALVGMTAEAVGGKRALIESAFASASALGPLAMERIEQTEECRALLSDFVRRSGVFSFVGFIEPNGQMRCLSEGPPIGFTGTAAFERMLERPIASVSARSRGLVRDEPVLIVTQPIRDGIELRGFMMITVTQRTIDMMRRISGESAPQFTVLFNHEGAMLTGLDNEQAVGMMPADRALSEFVQAGSRVTRGQTGGGQYATFAVAELIPHRLFALGTWPGGSEAPGGLQAVIMPLFLPLLMWIASLGVAYFAVYRLVVRHIRTLNRQMRRFALGQRDTPPDIIEDAPSELREVSVTFQKLTRILIRDECELEASVAEKTVLLKEIHHRVKNNLQLIASILNLQMRQVRDPSARRVLQSVQDRVIGLATIHRNLYQSDRLSEVRADKLIDEISRQLLTICASPCSGIAVRTRFDPIMMSPDKLVPLSLILTEAVTNALKYINRPEGGGNPWLEIALTQQDDRVFLTVTNSLSAVAQPEDTDSDSTRLGTGLIEAFAAQLEGELEQGELQLEDGRAWRLKLGFSAETGLEVKPAGDAAPGGEDQSHPATAP